MDNRWIRYKLKNNLTLKKNAIKQIVLKRGFDIETINKYAGKKVARLEKTNELISDLINSAKPFMVGRFGANEMQTIIAFLQKEHFPHVDTRVECVTNLCKTAGFFPNDINKGDKFVQLMLKCSQDIDLCGIWNLYMEDYVLKTFAPQANLTLLDYLEPWRMNVKGTKPWTNALKDRKILVIHPFEKTIRYQYENYRTKLFERKFKEDDILPPFELITMKAVQTINGNLENIPYNDWFEALAFMVDQCEKIDFDVAIIGCGAYGFPLAAAIKRMGKGAIHLGGATQILFGIMGKRWEIGSYKMLLNQIQNEYWTRPLPEEKPQNADEIEGGCYW